MNAIVKMMEREILAAKPIAGGIYPRAVLSIADLNDIKAEVVRLEGEVKKWKEAEENARQIVQHIRAAIGCPFDGSSILDFIKRWNRTSTVDTRRRSSTHD